MGRLEWDIDVIGTLAICVFTLFSSISLRDRALRQDAKPFVVESSGAHGVQYWRGRPKRKYFRILALDGGGVRGIIQLVALKHLEQATGKHTSDLFDGFIATSVGSAIGAMLLTPDHNGKPKYSAADVLEKIFENENLHRVFNQSFLRMLMTGNGAFGPKYSGRSKAYLLQEFLGSMPYNRLTKPMIMASWSTESLRPLYIANWTDNGYEDWPAWSVVQGGTSPPGYFPPTHVIDFSKDGMTLKLDLNDAGVYANAPISPVLIDMFTKHLDPSQKVLIVNLGTGFSKDPYPFRKIQKWGMLSWFSPLISSMGTLAGRMAYEQLEALRTREPERYKIFIINTPLASSERVLDDTRPKNVQNLLRHGREMVENNRASFNELTTIFNTDR